MLGRPKKEDSREKQYRVRLNDKEDEMLAFASNATGVPKSEIFRKALQEYCEKVKLQQAAEEIGDDTSWEDDRISLQRAVECPYCKAKNRIDLEDEGTVSTSERQMGDEVIYEFENVECQCHSCGRSFTVSGYISEYPIGAFNAESLQVTPIDLCQMKQLTLLFAATVVQCLSRVQNRSSAPIAVKSAKPSGWSALRLGQRLSALSV